MKKKIVVLPLDERPCNFIFPKRLFEHEEIQVVVPKVLGDKKQAANAEEIAKFLEEECQDADGLILSIDMLLYGGLVPSRIHYDDVMKLQELARVVLKLKKKNQQLLIYAFQVIMRCPNYSSADEEPDYYGQYGKMIHKVGDIIHKGKLKLCDDQKLEELLKGISGDSLQDYVSRREVNRAMNYYILNYLIEGYLDALVIPQDDAQPYGYAAMDQEEIREKISEAGLMGKVLIYPGADEVGLILLSRMLNVLNQRKPKVYVKYASENAKQLIPLYEGNSLDVTVKYQILSAGCQCTDSYEHADIILVVTAPAFIMEEASEQPVKAKGYCVERNLPEVIDFIHERVKEGKIVTIADNAYANGGEVELIKYLNREGLLDKIAGYAGWNTSSNTLGTAISEGVDYYLYGKTSAHQNYLMERYIEDVGYASVVRKTLTNTLKKYDMNASDVKEVEGIISKVIEKELNQYIKDNLSSISNNIRLKRVWMPWKRIFEIGTEAEYFSIVND